MKFENYFRTCQKVPSRYEQSKNKMAASIPRRDVRMFFGRGVPNDIYKAHENTHGRGVFQVYGAWWIIQLVSIPFQSDQFDLVINLTINIVTLTLQFKLHV